MAGADRSPVVRKYLAAALQRMPEEARWSIAEALTGQREDAEDHNIPKMILVWGWSLWWLPIQNGRWP